MTTNELYAQMGVSQRVLDFGAAVLAEIAPQFAHIDAVAEHNQAKVIQAMQENRLAAMHFNPSTGYGYDDDGRDNLERIYARIFGTEAALVRPQITCGTHALALALAANLLPGDELLSPVGAPYDTLAGVIGTRPTPGSLAEYGVSYRQVELLEGGAFDYDGIRAAINDKTKLITIQRSKGYATRPSYSVEQIGQLIAFCKQCKPDVICMVDNCYGEGGAYRDPNSPYRCWYDFDPKYKGGYRSWWGFETLPEVNEETPSYVDFITGEGGVIDTWLRRGAAGFRLDVADELPDEFIEKIRTAVKRVGPEKFLLGEVWEDATTKYGFNQRRTYLLGKGLDSVMNYPFKNAVLDFVKGKPAEQAANEILTICEHYPAPAMDTALNFLSTHDTERALTVIADEPANGRGRQWQSGRCVTGDAYEEGLLRLRMAYAIIYTLPGVPCLYYGDEIAMQCYRDPFNRAFFRWDAHEQRLRPVLAQLAQLRHTCEAFRTGKLWVLRAEGGILHYQRIGEVETAEVIVNRTEHIIVETLASGKSTEVNPMGFTIVVEEVGHNPNHSYYDYV